MRQSSDDLVGQKIRGRKEQATLAAAGSQAENRCVYVL